MPECSDRHPWEPNDYGGPFVIGAAALVVSFLRGLGRRKTVLLEPSSYPCLLETSQVEVIAAALAATLTQVTASQPEGALSWWFLRISPPLLDLESAAV